MSFSSARRSRTSQPARRPGMRVALAVFAVMVVAGPLLFGAVDRIFQVALLVLLALGVWAQPPAVVAPSRWGKRLTMAFLAMVALKEFAPANCFGSTMWRTLLTRNYGLEFPWTHHPEPGRAVDALLVCAVGAIWFSWVRRLAADRENRPILAWSLFASAVIVSIVSFATRGIDPKAIYGLRYTVGWTGFGPFPNRNHSADFLAMGAVVGCGCITWAGARRKWVLVIAGFGALALVLVALLTTQSRGGLIAFGLGLAIFSGLVFAKDRKRRALGLAVAAALLLGGLAMTVGAPVLARFHSGHSGVSNAMRVSIWKDAFGMWKDAPLLGHGLDSFAQIFPFYQKVELENQVVLHPESSWLLWLTELGVLPTLLALAAVALFLRKQIPIAFVRDRSFYLSMAGIAGMALILIHSLFDVPAHRWGTAGFALAALAMACPIRLGSQRSERPERPERPERSNEPAAAALVPLAVAAFWALPLFCAFPAWSPLYLARLTARDADNPGSVSLPELEAEARYFPLSPELHESMGIREMKSLGLSAPASWQRHFGIAASLMPASWAMLQAQARACQSVSPGLALHYWEMAVERGGIHRDEVLQTAVQETAAASPIALASWGRYVEANPQLLLSFARLLPDEQAKYYFSLWWNERAFSEWLTPNEMAEYYENGARWGDRAQFDDWMRRRPDLRTRDYRAWAGLLHAWGDDKTAWKLLSEFIAEPDYANTRSLASREQLETRWRIAPDNFVNAQELAAAKFHAGEVAQSDQVVIAAGLRQDAPPWFVRKAAYALDRSAREREAVALLLGDREHLLR